MRHRDNVCSHEEFRVSGRNAYGGPFSCNLPLQPDGQANPLIRHPADPIPRSTEKFNSRLVQYYYLFIINIILMIINIHIHVC